MSHFSGNVLLGDLDDFIAPAKSCSTGVFDVSTSTSSGTKQLIMEDDLDDNFAIKRANIIQTTVAKVATLSLEDCLACSGCITSAETILIQQQSTSTLIENLKNKSHKVFVAIISRPACVSIAHGLHISVNTAYLQIEEYLHSIGITIVVRQDMADRIAMVESINEYKRRSANQSIVSAITTHTSYAVNSELSVYPVDNQLIGNIDLENLSENDRSYKIVRNTDYFADPNSETHSTFNSPLITSNCPGWVCYAEKKAHSLVPYLSTTRSAQQIMGCLLRHLLPQHVSIDGLTASDLYLVSVVSCYDRKLEASRRDFMTSSGVHDVNCVLSSQELFDLLRQPVPVGLTSSNVEWDETWWKQMQEGCDTDFCDPLMSSGGILMGIVMEEKKRHQTAHVETKIVRNSDFLEVNVVNDDGSVVFSAAFIYGFRNIQNLVMKMKGKRCLYQVVEVMACPNGCLNGGGQVRPAAREDMIRIGEMLTVCVMKSYKMKKYYESDGKPYNPDDLMKTIESVYRNMGFDIGSKMAYEFFHTRFHVIPEVTINSLHW